MTDPDQDQQNHLQETHVILDKETLVILKLLDYVTKMEDLSRDIHDLLGGSELDKTKQALFKQLFPQGGPLPDTEMDLLMEQWVAQQRK